MPRVASTPPTNAAGAASTPNINCGDDENNANIITGSIEPYSPYIGGSPAICAYPIDIGIDTSAMIMPLIMSFGKVLSLAFFSPPNIITSSRLFF